MLKKFFSALALSSLFVGGLSVTQANAVAPDVDIAKVQYPGANFTIILDSDTEFEVAAGVRSITVSREFSFAESFLLDRQGQRLGVKVSMTQPNGTPIAQNGSGISFFISPSGILFKSDGNGPSVQLDYMSNSLVVPADATNYQGYLKPTIILENMSGAALPTGTYTYSIELVTLPASTVVPNDATGLTLRDTEFRYGVRGSTFTAPADVQDASISGTVCLDTSKATVGDTLTAEIVYDGVVTPGQNHFFETQSAFKQWGDAGYRSTNAESIIVTQGDLDWGVEVSLNEYVPNLVASSTHDIAFRFYNQNEVDVSSNCAPAKPAAPTLSVVSGTISVTGQFAVGSSAMTMSSGPECVAYDSAAPTVIVKTTTVAVNFSNRANYSCSINGLTTGKTYLVKFRDKFGEVYSEYSDASQILLPAAGYTVTSSYAGVLEAKKIVKVSSNVLPIEDYGTITRTIADGKGGFYMSGTLTGACPPSCGTSSVRIRHATATAMDSTFAGTGSVVINSFEVSNPIVSNLGYYGSNKDKWALPVNGFITMSPTSQSQIFLGSNTEATITSKILSVSDVTAVCSAAAAGYAPRPSGNMEISVVGAPINDVLLSITCYKSYTIGGTSSLLPLPILATMNPTTGALTFKAAMGTPSDTVNSVSARYSVNPNAASGEALVTAFATTSLVTQINNFPLVNAGTITDYAVIQLDSSLNVLSTTNAAWATTGVQISANPTIIVPQENTGTVFTIVTTNSVPSVVTFAGSAVGTALLIDRTASEITNPTIALMIGHAVPSNETALPVQVTATGKDAAGWINLSTGVLTTGEVLTYTSASGNGLAKFWVRGSDKTPYLIYSDVAAPANLTVLKWMDPSYLPPTGPVPAVTSKDVKYSKNTPTVGAKVTLTGTDLDAVISAKIGANAATIGTKTATSLQLTIPTASADGTVDITLTTADGDTVVDTFTYVGTGVAQTVTVGALAAAVTVGDADLTLSATVAFSPVDAGTAGAITWSSETPTVCSIVANKARLLTAGTCTVKATAAASGVLLAGTDTESTTVSDGNVVSVRQVVTVAALAASVRVGDPDLTLSATVSWSPSIPGTAGAITWSSETPTVCSIVANKARLLTAGTCTVKATAAASGDLLSGSDTESTTVSAAPVVAAAQTVTLTGPTKVVVDLDGFDVVSSASSGLAIVYSTTTPSVCTVSSAGRVVAIAVGTCEITSSQAGNANWLAASKTLTITVAKTPTTPVTEKGDIKKPLALSKTGTFLKNGDAQLGWNRSKGTLAVKLNVVYIGPVKATASFKVGSKSYTCTSSFGILKKQSSSKLQTITSPNLCTGKTEKTQLAALKKITTSTVVTITVVRDMYFPTTYKKIRTKTRILYAKLG